jgi:hypothetical protein
MSRIIRVGLWLLPWLPIALLVNGAMFKFAPSLCPDLGADYALEPGQPVPCRFVEAFGELSVGAFVAGIVCLLIGGVQKLVRLSRESV